MSDEVMATAVEPVEAGPPALAGRGEVALPGLITVDEIERIVNLGGARQSPGHVPGCWAVAGSLWRRSSVAVGFAKVAEMTHARLGVAVMTVVLVASSSAALAAAPGLRAGHGRAVRGARAGGDAGCRAAGGDPGRLPEQPAGAFDAADGGRRAASARGASGAWTSRCWGTKTLVAYAAAGTTADDGERRNKPPYTSALLSYLEQAVGDRPAVPVRAERTSRRTWRVGRAGSTRAPLATNRLVALREAARPAGRGVTRAPCSATAQDATAGPDPIEQGRGAPHPSSAPSTSINAASCGTEPGRGSTTGSPASTCWPRSWPLRRESGPPRVSQLTESSAESAQG